MHSHYIPHIIILTKSKITFSVKDRTVEECCLLVCSFRLVLSHPSYTVQVELPTSDTLTVGHHINWQSRPFPTDMATGWSELTNLSVETPPSQRLLSVSGWQWRLVRTSSPVQNSRFTRSFLHSCLLLSIHLIYHSQMFHKMNTIKWAKMILTCL